MPVPMIQINWMDGRITRIPEICVADAFGQNVQPELEIKLDDLSDGIWMLLRHNEPIKPQQGVHKEQDPRGLPCMIMADTFYQIATAEDIPEIATLYYEGEPYLVNDKGEIINLSKLNALKTLYLGDGGDTVAGDVAAVAVEVARDRSLDARSDCDEVAAVLGIPASYLKEALGDHAAAVADAEGAELAEIYDCI